jgi:hypothetical protein
MKMANDLRVSVTNEPSRFPTENPSLKAAGKTRIPAEPKAARKTVEKNREPSEWDFRANGLLFWEDVKEAQALKREDPDAFKSSVRAQKIVAFVEDLLLKENLKRISLEPSGICRLHVIESARRRNVLPRLIVSVNLLARYL